MHVSFTRGEMYGGYVACIQARLLTAATALRHLAEFLQNARGVMSNRHGRNKETSLELAVRLEERGVAKNAFACVRAF